MSDKNSPLHSIGGGRAVDAESWLRQHVDSGKVRGVMMVITLDDDRVLYNRFGTVYPYESGMMGHRMFSDSIGIFPEEE